MNESKITKKMENDLIFSLDIGTRNVVGTLSVKEDDQYIIIDHEILEHPERAMFDGQIHDIDKVVDYYYYHWFGKPKRSNFLSDLSPLKERNDFIRYDMFKDGHKLDEFSNKIIERSMILQI